MANPLTTRRTAAIHWASIVALCMVLFLMSGYVILRYKGLTAEGDTSGFAYYTRAIMNSGKLIPSKSVIYPNGYGYQSLLIQLLYLSGIQMSTLQSITAPFLSIWLIIPAWLAYREFTGSPRAAALAVTLLLIQPEFLFPILRGTHEKFTRGLMFVCLYLMLRSLRERPGPRLPKTLLTFAAFIVSFYLAGASLITYNNFMASSFIFAFGLSLLMAWGVLGWVKQPNPALSQTLRRLLIIVASLSVLSFIFTFYAYPPAQHELHIMNTIIDRFSALLLQVENSTTNPYAVINLGWNSTLVYLFISLANWLLLGGSLFIWLSQARSILQRRVTLEERQVLLWAFYGAFAFQGALSILADVSGAIASNLQYRMFASFVMFAAPLAARWLVDWRMPARLKRGLGRAGLYLALACLGLLALLKATTEPMLGNLWLFYRPAELQSLTWFTSHAKNDSIWTDYTERLSAAYQIQLGITPNNNILDIYTPKPFTTTFMISEITHLRSQSLKAPLPIQYDSLRIYDNGETALYRRRPVTAFEK